MGASISFDSKYRLILDTEVECISTNTSTSASTKTKATKNKVRYDDGSGSGSDNDNDNDNDSGSDTESGSGSGSDTDSDSENKTYTVKITPEITGYIRSYLRKNQFLDEFDLITEIDLDRYNHAPESALVFNSDSILFNTNNQTIEAVGEWEYIEPNKPAVVVASSSPAHKKSKSKSKGGRHRDRDRDDDDHDDDDRNDNKYKTKDDDLPVSEIEGILKDKFEEYNKTREFVIHESKNSFLSLNIKSVEIVKA
jgi:hypothetical protein